MKKNSGFTLIELLVVIAIIGILAGLIVPKIIGAAEKARIVSCANNMKGIVRAMQLYEEDFNESCIRATVGTDTTLDIFGSLYYQSLTNSKGNNTIGGITTPNIYNCPSSNSTPPSIPAAGYKNSFPALAGAQAIDYGVVITGATSGIPAFNTDPDGNAILIELDLNHNGRNVAFWNSTVRFFRAEVGADYPNNVNSSGANAGAVVATEIVAASQVIKATAANVAALPVS